MSMTHSQMVPEKLYMRKKGKEVGRAGGRMEGRKEKKERKGRRREGETAEHMIKQIGLNSNDH